MPTFTVEHETSLPVVETFDKVADYFQNSEGLKKLDSDLHCEFDKNAKTGRVKGSKFECDIRLIPGIKTKVIMTITISFLLTPFKSTIEGTLREKMSKILG